MKKLIFRTKKAFARPYFYDAAGQNMEDKLKRLQEIDWARNHDNWLGRTIREDGKDVLKSL